ncbi:SDR family NAD(P)-dependent oxidoreductase [Lutimonas saemankumensis]|uniref:oxidoreductase n=1 Tax=Lutimonas saemankumensis TaxID=483016 RepID=UPI001CD43BB5|nr:oxidoreductase [Lutimonas saemankumensis]MCA0931307.1 SDR family NAD(P)-dependent oxidoreductase [Lutimonas saemankumensis]
MKKVIVITGASSGMGKVHALSLLQKGHIVYGLARRVEKMKEIVKAGGIAIAMDITSEKQIQDGVDQILNEQGKIDVLINNAGYAVYGSVEESSIDSARRQFEVNIFGLASITQKVIPGMRKNKSGRIINISSMGGKMYTPFGAWYHATKHALEGWSDCLRVELTPFNVEVVVIEPGGIETEFTNVFLDNLQGDKENGPYADKLQKLIKSTQEMHDSGKLSKPNVITKLIDKAVHSKKPKTRYVAGAYAKPLMFMRKYLGDRRFDKILMNQFT